MEERYFTARDINGAREAICDYIQIFRDKKVIYFNGWSGFGVAPVLRSLAQELLSIKAKKTPPKLCFDRIIYIDCSAWESRRAMQRKMAEELELGHETMAMFDKQDKEDDFNGVDQSSRDVILGVSQAFTKTLVDTKFMMIFLNGSGDEVDVSSFGIIPAYCDHTIVWTFKTRFLTMSHHNNVKLRYTHIYLKSHYGISNLSSSEFHAILYEEAASMVARHPCMRGIDLRVVMDCCVYESFLHSSFHRATGFNWAVHASNYWMCDGITKGAGTGEIGNTLQQEIHWERVDSSLLDSMLKKFMRNNPEAPFLIVRDDDIVYKERPYRWIAITSMDPLPVPEELLSRATSLFIALEKSTSQVLPSGFLKHCSNLGVLVLSYCAFSFVSPPFIQCHELRFLGLDHCTHHDNTSEGENNEEWTFLQNLWVLDLRYTEWDAILSEEKMDAVANLRELNIEGLMCWWLIRRLQMRRLCRHMQRLRIIKPTRKTETSTDNGNILLVDKTGLEILDLSGNRDMENLSTSLSSARSLQMLILDGCDGLENVVIPDGLPSSLRSFSFDGYGPAKHWTSTFQLTLKNPGCDGLENVVIPDGLPSSLRSFSFDGYGPAKHWTSTFQPTLNIPELERPGSADAKKRDIKTSKISLQGCKQLDNLLVRGLPNLVELDLSRSAIKVLDFNSMVVDVPGLKRLFLLGCEYLQAIRWGSMKQLNLELVCIDTRPKTDRAHGFTQSSLAQHKHICLYATLADARLARSLYPLVKHYYYTKKGSIWFNIHITSSASTEYGGGKRMIEPSNQHRTVLQASQYDDVSFKIDDALPLPFPQPPTGQLDRHIEISDGSSGLEGELADPHDYCLSRLINEWAESLHVHDASTCTNMDMAVFWKFLKWCRIERCPNLVTVSPPAADEDSDLENLVTIWASDLPMAHCIWSKGSRVFVYENESFSSLRHMHLRSCPTLQFVLPVWVDSFPSLETLHIIHCGNLSHVFVLDGRYPEEIRVHGVPFPKLTSIHLYDLPKLQQIMGDVKMVAPALKTIWIRGCFGLRRLPALAGREPGARRPSVEVEKDVWDALEWDGLAAGHHPDLFEPPVHSRYYRQRRLLRGTVLR